MGRWPRGPLQLRESASGSDLGRPGSTWALLACRLPSSFSPLMRQPQACLGSCLVLSLQLPSQSPRGEPRRQQGPIAGTEQTWSSREWRLRCSFCCHQGLRGRGHQLRVQTRDVVCSRAGSPCGGLPLVERNNSNPTVAGRPFAGHCPRPDPATLPASLTLLLPTSVCLGEHTSRHSCLSALHSSLS